MSTPDTSWVTDITYLHTAAGWVYLAVVLDLFSRKVVGHTVHPSESAEHAADLITVACAAEHVLRGQLVISAAPTSWPPGYSDMTSGGIPAFSNADATR